MTEAAADAFHVHLQKIVSTGERKTCDVEFIGRGAFEGRTIPVHLESSNQPLPEGTECRCALVDLTDLRREQEARRASEAQLHHAQKMEAIGTLASGVAHDFNNLLMGIRGCASVALSKLDPMDPARMYLDEVKLATGRGAAITQQLLTFGRTRKAEAVVFEMTALVERTKRLLSHLLGEDVDVRLRLGDADSRVRADPTQVEQVLLNLGRQRAPRHAGRRNAHDRDLPCPHRGPWPAGPRRG
jgi:C4-dicarboxylate-specific signal transduction histidine kinase